MVAAAEPAGAPTAEPPAAPAAEAAPTEPVDPDAPPPSEWDKLQGRQPQGGDSEERSLIGQLFQTLLALLVVIGIIYIAGKVAMSRLGSLGFASRGGTRVKVVERVQLDPRHSIYLVQIESGPLLLLGAGEGKVALLTSLDTPSEPSQTGAEFRRALARSAQPEALPEAGKSDATES